MVILEFLKQIDRNLLYFINVRLENPIMDQFFMNLTDLHKILWFKFIVLPLILGFFIYKYRTGAFKVLLMLVLAVGLSDLIAYRGVKSIVQRARPFDDPIVSTWVRKLGPAHGTSFPSNHAANCFAGAAILGWYFTRRRYFFYGLAAIVAYSRCAVGVHFPSDVLGGALLGIFVGYLIRTLLINRVQWLWLPDSVSKKNTESWTWRSRSQHLEDV